MSKDLTPHAINYIFGWHPGHTQQPRCGAKITSLVAKWSKGDMPLDYIIQGSNTNQDVLSQVSCLSTPITF